MTGPDQVQGTAMLKGPLAVAALTVHFEFTVKPNSVVGRITSTLAVRAILDEWYWRHCSLLLETAEFSLLIHLISSEGDFEAWGPPTYFSNFA